MWPVFDEDQTRARTFTAKLTKADPDQTFDPDDDNGNVKELTLTNVSLLPFRSPRWPLCFWEKTRVHSPTSPAT